MPVSKIKRLSVQLSLPEATFRSVNILAQRENKYVSKYIQFLIDRETLKNGLPLYLVDQGSTEQ